MAQAKDDNRDRLISAVAMTETAIMQTVTPGFDALYFGKITAEIHVEHGKAVGVTVNGRRFKANELGK